MAVPWGVFSELTTPPWEQACSMDNPKGLRRPWVWEEELALLDEVVKVEGRGWAVWYDC